LHHIDLLIVIDLERGLGVQLLVRTTRSASPTENGQAWRWKARQAWQSRRAQTISEFLVFDLPERPRDQREISRSRQLPARPGKSAQTDRNRRIT